MKMRRVAEVLLAVAAQVLPGAAAELDTYERDRSLVWARAGDGPGCPAVLLSPLFVLMSTRCVRGRPPFNLTLLGPGVDEGAPPPPPPWDLAVPTGSVAHWGQRRREVLVLHAPHDTSESAAPNPALILVRVERPFALDSHLQPAPLFSGPPEQTSHCRIYSWAPAKPGSDVTDLSKAKRTLITTGVTVLTPEQCRPTGTVRHPSQLCVELPGTLEKYVQPGSPLLCGEALVGVQDAPTLYNISGVDRLHLFSNASFLLPWLNDYVTNLQVVSTNTDGAKTGVLTSTSASSSISQKSAATRSNVSWLQFFVFTLAVLTINRQFTN